MRIIITAFIALLLPLTALAASYEEDVQEYIQIFKGDKARHSDAADTFAWMGLSDTHLFDIIEQRLLTDAQEARNDRTEKNRVARYIRSLGFSGQSKYIPTITKFLGDGVYSRYAEAALVDQALYQKWNPIISKRDAFDSKYSDDVNRIMNMLRADDLLLKEIGAKRIFFRHQNEELLDMLAQELRASYTAPDREYSNAVAWLVKALGNAADEKYRSLIEEVRAKTQDSKVRRYAQKALECYDLKEQGNRCY